ncbi:prolyl aminopeptidase-like protein [Xylariomycetidae sp. FL0641]|nr:prolyl aminopeptidase-like protein [Xylariomycetidae sp. FL0641]
MDFPFHIKTHIVPGQHVREFARATAHSQNAALQIHVKQYVPKDNPCPAPGDVTIVGAHANGFPKELYEALWAELHAQSRRPGSGFRLRGIWIADVANQGYSGTLNEAALGDDPSWADGARDLLAVVGAHRAEMPRPLVGLGHSFGGNILAHLALLHPRLLTTLVLLDPVIVKFRFTRAGPGNGPAQSSTFRREVWPSRAAAAAAFARSPFYRAWDPRVLDAWVAHALRPVPTLLFPGRPGDPAPPAVTLRTTKHQEVFTFFRPLWPHVDPVTSAVSRAGAPDFDVDLAGEVDGRAPFPFYRGEGAAVLRRLPELRPSVLWVYGGASDLGTPAVRAEKMATTGVGQGGSGGAALGRVAEHVVPDRGHLFPMEVPRLCAELAAPWLREELARWRREEDEYLAWTRKPMREKMVLSEEFIDKVGRQHDRSGQKKEKDGGGGKPKL